jgi:hypothetical protein
MPKPTRFEHFRYLGDKRSLIVYDLDLIDDDSEVARDVADLLASERFLAFGPDTLAEARNRGYRPHHSITQRERAQEAAEEAAADTAGS